MFTVPELLTTVIRKGRLKETITRAETWLTAYRYLIKREERDTDLLSVSRPLKIKR